MATIAENLLALNEEKLLQKRALEEQGQDMTGVPYTQYHEKISAIQTGGEKDMLQARVDVDDCYYLFHKFRRDNVDFIKNLDTSNVADMSYMFYECEKLTTIPQLDTKNVTNMAYMFRGCRKLTQIPQLDTKNVTNMYNMFYECGAITEIPPLDTKNVTNMNYMFYVCSSLITVALIDLIGLTSAPSYLFGSNKNLTNLTIKNIKYSLAIGGGTTWGTLLTNESLINTIKELWDLTGSTSQTLTLSTTSKTNIANIYVKLVDVTDEMRAEDEYIDNKKPCVVCESTDEGAMTLTEYATSKNWAIA